MSMNAPPANLILRPAPNGAEWFPPDRRAFAEWCADRHPSIVYSRVNSGASSSAVVLQAYLDRARQLDSAKHLDARLRDELSRWTAKKSASRSQRHFWRFYDQLLDADNRLPEFESGLSEFVERSAPDVVIDGQRRLRAISESHERELSHRDMRAIAQRILAELDGFEFASTPSLSLLARETLTREIAVRVRLRCASKGRRPVFAPSLRLTRERVLCFLLRTGNPPPAYLDRRMGADQVPVPIGKASQRLEHGTICRRYYRGNLLDAVRRVRGATPLNQGPQDCTSAARRPKPAGCRRIWTDFPVAEFRGKIGSAGRRKVVPDVRLGGRRRRLCHPLRAAVNLRRAYP